MDSLPPAILSDRLGEGQGRRVSFIKDGALKKLKGRNISVARRVAGAVELRHFRADRLTCLEMGAGNYDSCLISG